MFVLFLSLIIGVACRGEKVKVNVCSSLSSYLNLASDDCWHNPDVGSSAEQIVKRYGYNFETHSVVTEDGYELEIFRIPAKSGGSQAVLLQHGITYNALCWLSLGNESLAFQLSNMGYDVWLGNFRGNIFSYNPKPGTLKSNYWDFSFFELGYYDLPAMLNYISTTANSSKKIVYIGHSMGGTASVVYAITRQNEAESRLSSIFGIAPVVHMKYSFNLIFLLIPLARPLFGILNLFNIYSFGISTFDLLKLFYKICLFGPFSRICAVLTQVYLSVSFGTIPPEMLPMQLTISPSGASLKTFMHYIQDIASGGQFAMFDYGKNNNLQLYGTNKPPSLDLGLVNVPVYIFYGRKDVLADEKDVLTMYNELTGQKYITPVVGDEEYQFQHLDFVLNREKISYFYKELFSFLSYSKWNDNK